MRNQYIVSAYATSPSFYQWDPVAEAAYFERLAACPQIVGVEHPFLPHSDKYPLDWLLENIPNHWELVITLLPPFMQLSKSNPDVGLASLNESSRLLAISMIKELNQYVGQLNAAFKRKVVKAINFHSSPKNEKGHIRGDQHQLKKSLTEIISMDWFGVALNLEHCDAYSEASPETSDKGFLALKHEIEVIQEVGNFGIVLNWGRSAIELRSTKGPIHHIKAVAEAKLLKGFFFSGCTENASSPYGAWKDTHIPPQNFMDGQYLQNDSLLGAPEIREVLKLLNEHEVFLGVKILDPHPKRDLDRLAGLNLETIAAIRRVYTCTGVCNGQK